MEDKSTDLVWKSFCSALGAEYREHKEIKGSSGLTHPVQAIGVGERHKRVIIISAEHNPRVAALMRVDVQATMPDVRVLVARPMALDLAHTARVLFFTKEGNLDLSKLSDFAVLMNKQRGKSKAATNSLVEKYVGQLGPLLGAAQRSGFPIRTHILNVIEQIMALDWSRIVAGEVQIPQTPFNFLSALTGVDNLHGDRSQGICPVPLYELTDTDWELFRDGIHTEDIQERLRALNIYQYFFPPKDTLALGLIEGGVGRSEDILRGFQIAEHEGHQLAANELIRDAASLNDIIDGLGSLGYVAHVGLEHELTEAGKKQRVDVKISPRESLVEKLLGRLKIDVSFKLSDLWKFPGS